MKNAKVSALLLPGIGTVDHLRMAADCGVTTIRVATHCTEADVSEQHINLGRKMGLDTVGFLMMAHMIEPKLLVEQAQLMESYGANRSEENTSELQSLMRNSYAVFCLKK